MSLFILFYICATYFTLSILLPPDRIKSITPDRGSEFALYREFSLTGEGNIHREAQGGR